MANAVASIASLSQSSLAGTKVAVSSTKVVASAKCAPVQVRASSSDETQSRRSFFSLAAVSLAATALVGNAHALESIKLEPPPPPSGGLPGTENADQARDTDLDLKTRFYLQPKTPQEAAERVKVAVKEIKDVKPLIDRKAWPYVQNGLRSSASYLRYDLNTIGSSKPKDQIKAFKALTTKAIDAMDSLDYAAREKSPAKAAKAYAESVALFDQVLSNL
jgi:photosystem II oxygen-evolving enhancer protein 3